MQPNSMQTDSGQFIHAKRCFDSLSSPFIPLKNVTLNPSSGLYLTLKPRNETYNESCPESTVIVVIYANEHIDKSTD